MGARLEAPAAQVGISRPRIVQMFDFEHSMFLNVVHSTFAVAEPTMAGRGEACGWRGPIRHR